MMKILNSDECNTFSNASREDDKKKIAAASCCHYIYYRKDTFCKRCKHALFFERLAVADLENIIKRAHPKLVKQEISDKLRILRHQEKLDNAKR